MTKKLARLCLVSCLVAVLLSPGLGSADGSITVVSSSAEAGYPSQLNFNLSVGSDYDITDIRLHYSVEQISFAQVISEAYLEFAPATSVEVTWTWDMRRTGGLPPGTIIDYWWTVQDASGEALKTAPVRLRFDDDRYSWQSLTEGGVTMYWYEGNLSFAQELMSATQQALVRLNESTGASLEKEASIYIYADTRDLQGALVFPQEWTGGVAFTRYGVIVIGISPGNIEWGKRAIAHELSHLVIHQITLNPYGGLPTWLDEGLAMYSEGALEPAYADFLERAVTENSLISARSLASPFSAYAEKSYLSYAQSYSLVEFLIGKYGQGKMLELLSTFEQGSGYDDALNEVYGFDMDGLNTLWRDYIVEKVQGAGVTAMLPESRVTPGRLFGVGVSGLEMITQGLYGYQ